MDQSPFAIEDLMNELEAGSDDDFSDEEWSEESKLIAKGKDLPTLPDNLQDALLLCTLCKTTFWKLSAAFNNFKMRQSTY